MPLSRITAALAALLLLTTTLSAQGLQTTERTPRSSSGDRDAGQTRSVADTDRTVERERADGQTGVVPFWTPPDDAEQRPVQEVVPEWMGQTIRFAGDGGEITLAEGGGPFALTGLNYASEGEPVVYDLRSGEIHARMAEPLPKGDRVLTPDGERIVLLQKGSGQEPSQINVYDTGGRLVMQTPLGEATLPKLLAVDNTYAFATMKNKRDSGFGSGRGDLVVGVKLSSGALLFVVPIEDFITLDEKKATISPQGDRLAIADYSDELVILDLPSGDLIARKQTNARGSTNIGLQFSPNGRGLALATSDYGRDGGLDRTVISVLDAESGDIVAQTALLGGPSDKGPYPYSYKGPLLEWFPDSRHLLIEGVTVVAVDKPQPLAVISGLRGAPGVSGIRLTNGAPRRAMSGSIVSSARLGSDDGAFVAIPIPLDAYGQRFADVSSPDSAPEDTILRPGSEVGLVIDVADTQFGQDDETKTSLDNLLFDVLESFGLVVVEMPKRPSADDALPVLRLSYREVKGDVAYETKGILDRSRTGRTLNSTNVASTLEWTDATGKRVYWRQSIDIDPRMTRVKEFSDKGARDAVFEQLRDRIQGQPIPYHLTSAAKPLEDAAAAPKERRRRRRSSSADRSDSPERDAKPSAGLTSLPAFPTLPVIER